jgi:hypothetical protein
MQQPAVDHDGGHGKHPVGRKTLRVVDFLEADVDTESLGNFLD